MSDRRSVLAPARLVPATLTAAALVAAALLGAGCDDAKAPPAEPTSDDLLLSIDGIDITFGELEPIIEFLRTTHPEVGRKTVVQTVLERQVLPLRLAERAFGAEREALRRQAEDLRTIATNVYELEQNTPNLTVHERKKYTRLQPDLPVAMFLFDQLQLGNVSPPLAVPRGFIVTGAHDYVEVPVTGEDMVDATQVGFFTHTVGAWRDWLLAEQARIADAVTFIHPLYRDALPSWCNPRK